MVNRIQHTAVVPAEHVLERLDQVAAALFPQYSRAQLQGWIRAGELVIDGLRVKPSKKLNGGETIAIDAEIDELEYLPEALDINVVFEDDDILVLNKNAGLVVHPGAGNPNGTLLNALLHHIPGTAILPRAGIVHRLDKDTTGVMVVAKTTESYNQLTRLLSERRVTRLYQAIVHGSPPASGVIREPIGRHRTQRTRMAVTRGGKEAVTNFSVESSYRGFSHLHVALETGRTHQIRVHMHHLGFPLVGDPVYGKKVRLGDDQPILASFRRQALHARSLAFVHPATEQPMKFSAPVPEDYAALLAELDQNGDG